MSWKKAYHANGWGALGGNAVGVTSITQLTYRTFADVERAINEIAEAGYTGTELFDGNLSWTMKGVSLTFLRCCNRPALSL